jgi:SAM-dependent methyltransferase
MTERHFPGRTDSIARYQDQLHKARYVWATKLLKDVSGQVIDIACGVGYGSQMLAQGTGANVIGIDASHETVEYARANYVAPRLSFRPGDAQRLSGIETGSISAIVSFETVEHLARPDLFFAEAGRVLRDTGILVLSTPNRLLSSTLYPIRGRPNNPFHLFEYTIDGLRKDIEQVFDLRQMCGQAFVREWLACWPIQVAAKGLCSALRSFGAYGIIDAIYHNPTDCEVLPVHDRPSRVPSILLAVCRHTVKNK